MDETSFLPNDVAECHRLLVAACKQAVQLEQQAAEAKRQVAQAEQRITESEQRVAELGRVLDATSASFRELQQEYSSTLEQLAWYKRWVHGHRRERIIEGEGQQHLFDLAANDGAEAAVPADAPEPHPEITGSTRRRRRELDFSRLPHHRHELDVAPE